MARLTKETVLDTLEVRSAVGAKNYLLSKNDPLTPEQLARIEVKEKTNNDGVTILAVWVDGKNILNQVNDIEAGIKNLILAIDDDDLAEFFA